MTRIFLTIFFLCIIFVGLAQQIPARMPGGRMINDFADVIGPEEEERLETRLQQYKIDSAVSIVIIIADDLVKSHAPEFAVSTAQKWGLEEKSILFVADIRHITYGFFVSSGLRKTYPDWVLEKIEYNHIRPNFREAKYSAGITEAVQIFTGLRSGSIDPIQLKKDSSNNISMVLILVVLFFFLIFPVWQFIAMRRAHFSSRPVDFFSSVLLMNTFGSRGKNVFDDFSKGKGIFASSPDQGTYVSWNQTGGGGIRGSW